MAAEHHFRSIGKGFCGSVWAVDREGQAIAMKREDGGPGRTVVQDSTMHIRIEGSLKKAQDTMSLATRVNIPKHHRLVTDDDERWWRARAARFPPGYQHCNTLLTERILPLQKPARENLIDLYCPEAAKEAVKNNRQDEDCLVRPYLGRRKFNTAPSRFFTLRNKPLCINQMESIDLPVREYAKIMAETLAVLYWLSKTDANDVEFVLAPGRPGDITFEHKIIGPHTLWLLDFDCVKLLTHDEAGIARAASAYMRNDPYWPRPGSDDEADRALWSCFREHFLSASALVLGEKSPLPHMLLERLEQLGEERRSNLQSDGKAD